MSGLAEVPAVMLLIVTPLLLESPRWLVMKGRHVEAEGVLLSTSDSFEEACARMQETIEASGYPSWKLEMIIFDWRGRKPGRSLDKKKNGDQEKKRYPSNSERGKFVDKFFSPR